MGNVQSHMPHLDALRAVAVVAVMFRHYHDGPLAPYGSLGVALFYVLSGFLITGILLRARDDVASGQSSRVDVWRRFFVRRALRIFPAYYLALAVAYALDVPQFRASLAWHATYVSNVWMAQLGRWPGVISPLWSLAVEEQFYLLWPLVILWTPRRILPHTIAFCVLVGPLWRGYCFAVAWGPLWARIMLPGCVDQLALGGLLAWAVHSRINYRRELRAVGWGALGLAMLSDAMSNAAGVSYGQPLYHSFVGLAFTALVDSAATGFRGIVGSAASSRSLQYVGRISYGIYLYHLFIAFPLLRVIGLPRHWALATILTLALATLSWLLVEAPLNKLKRLVPMKGGRSSA